MSVAAVKDKQPDKAVELPYTPEKGSLAWRLDQLAVGQSISESTRIAADDLALTDTKSVLDGMSSIISSSVTRLQQRVDKRFTSERGKWLTNSDDVICTICITRTE